MSESLNLAWLWIGAKRRKVLNPLSKAIVVLFFILFALLPCPFGLIDTPLLIVGGILLLLCVAIYIVFSLNDHKIWLALFILLQIAGMVILALASYSYCARESDIVSGIPLSDVSKYSHGSFKLTNGQAATKYSAILSVGQQNVLMAPLVPSLNAWNISMPVPAWAFTAVSPWSDGSDMLEEWADPNLHEGVLATGMDEAVELLIAQYNLIPSKNKTVQLNWGYLDRELGFIKEMLIIVNVVSFVVILLAIAVWAWDYYRLFWLSTPPSDEEEHLYLLKKEGSFYNSADGY